jgi:DAK2 domain fusion protein YloV
VTEQTWDGPGLLAALRHAASTLHAQVDEVNALNVFPVPDGDTGSNMLATVQAAIREADAVPEHDRSVSAVANALSMGALMGARGNSGVILSQLFRGLGEAVAGVESVGGRELAEAIRQGCNAAFGAVTQPVEGTILTVARDAAGAALIAAETGGTLDAVLAASVVAAAESVERTPELLAVLRRAGVVDAGGKGLELLLRGALASVRGEHLPVVSRLPHDIPLPAFEALEADGYGYETVYMLTPNDGASLDVGHVRIRLDEMGESVLVAGDQRALKIHIHNDRPDQVIAFGLSLGALSRISVENLDRQATDVRQRAAAATANDGAAMDPSATEPEAPPVVERQDGLQIVAVAAGEGLARVFTTLGAAAVVQGGQGANPSAGELADAIRAIGADEVIVLPNNPNVRLAAKQAGHLTPHVRVEVVPTRNAAEGVAAMLALDSSAGLHEAAKSMAGAARRIQSLQVTVAVRDARIGPRRVRRGDYIVLGASDGLLATNRDRTTAILAASRKLKLGFELLTVYRGKDVDHAAAEELRDALRLELGEIEIELVEGGQPHYDFLISAE